MRLSRLELSGFKSFADNVDLHFGDGVIAVVGPNGCGKSNISDAVRWVLGEQRARLLRSARMDEVIFQGSVKRRPINIAEVSLVFDNSDGVLPVSYHEVVITRRLSRSGQSEYLLNQTPVRLRDIMDVLRGTGLGSDAGVVIEAQMIDRLLSERAEERRSLFEEAAGIGLYRDRKDTTERRLDRTAADLQRLADVISEVQTQVRSLSRQRGKTERHRRFTEERFAIVMTLARRELAEFETRHAALRERREVLRREVPTARDAVAERQRIRQQRAQERSAAETRRTELERQLNEARIEIERLERDSSVAVERLQAATDRRAKASEERTLAEARVEQLTREFETANEERMAAESAHGSVQTELNLRTASEEETRTNMQQQRSTVRELEESQQRLAESLRALAGERGALTRDVEELGRQEADVRDRHSTATTELDATRTELSELRAQASEREREERETGAALERARHSVAAAREHEAAVRIERREIEERIAHSTARREVLAELERKREGFAPAVRALLRDTERFRQGAILGPLSDFVRTVSSEAPLAERLLGDWLQAVLVRDAGAVDEIQRWHADARPGPLILLPVDPGPLNASSTLSEPALDVSPPARAWVSALLEGHRATDTAGSVIRRSNGAVFLAGPQTAGPLSRRAELDELERELEQAGSNLQRLTAAATAAASAHVAAETALQEATERSAQARAGLREAQGAVDDAARRVQRAEREHGEAAQAVERIAELRSAQQARLTTVQEQLQADEAERQRLAEQLTAQQSVRVDLEAAQEAARERRVQWQVEEVQVSAQLTAALDRETRATTALKEANATIQRLSAELTDIEATRTTLTDQRTQWGDTLEERQTAVKELDSAARAATAALEGAERALSEADTALDDARQQLEQASEESHRVELEATEAEGRRRSLMERIEAEWHKPLDALLKEAEPVEGGTDVLRTEAQRLEQELERIGPVNLLAVEEYAEEQKRLDFLESQRDDLVAARDSLNQALREIESTARKMFLETFDAIRENFHSVFQTLFEGGDCEVRLADDADPLGSDILIQAAPRGKRIQRIHLLSTGERALVATSLLFAIYLTKPAPFCLLDEVDAPLDDSNVMRFVRLLEEFKADTQFIVITHNPRTMQVADSVYGVTMQEPGVSSIVGVRLGEVEPSFA